jgi:hypothetical protein
MTATYEKIATSTLGSTASELLLVLLVELHRFSFNC